MSDEYLRGVQALFDGEVMGERLVLGLLAAARTPREAYHFATILQLETETKARLRPLMLKLGLGVAETADISVVPGRVADYTGRDWQDYSRLMATHLGAVVARYEAIAAMGPAEDQPVLQAVVRHEQALLGWATTEAAGPSETSLDAIIEMLNFPVSPAG
jgi:hypothetical protein